jgi:prolycopene isomerase
MQFHRESRRDAYDAIVVGSGIGGLTAAALLAHAGRRVLVVERHDRTGGYAHSFRRRRYRFDSAVHMIGGCGPSELEGGGLVDRVLRAVGVRERCDFVQVDPFYTAAYPGCRIDVPSGVEGFVSAHTERFPADAQGLRELVQLCLDLRREAQRAPDPHSVLDLARMRKLFPTLVRYHRATLAEVVDEKIRDPRLAAVFGTLWPYLGLPPSKVSFLYWATMLTSYAADGAWYCRGTFQRLADALAEAVGESGGEVLLKSSVRRIEVADGRVRGVVLENGQRIAAPVVVSNADARQTYEELLGAEQLPAQFLAKLRRMRPSVSAFVVYCASRLDPRERDLAYESFFYDGFDHDAHYSDVLSGRPSWVSVTAPSRLDPGLAPSGEHLYVLTTLVPFAASTDWRRGKGPLTEHVLALAERHVPGLRDGLTFIEAGTPRTMERYTRNQAGAIYGWELSPDQVGPGRLPSRAPVEGLALAGHWTRPGGGVYGVVTSGVEAARRLLQRDLDDLLAAPSGAGAA